MYSKLENLSKEIRECRDQMHTLKKAMMVEKSEHGVSSTYIELVDSYTELTNKLGELRYQLKRTCNQIYGAYGQFGTDCGVIAHYIGMEL